MTIDKSKVLLCQMYLPQFDEEEKQALTMAIEALERRIPYKPQVYEDKYYGCKCGNVLLHKWKKYNTELMPKSEGLPYCLNCGQLLDWSDEE